ncbi:MAG: DUF3800 domain-containing protein [Rhodospirillaceae bacterium]
MYLLFVDESGHPPPASRKDTRYFVMAGAIVPEPAWHKLRDSLLGMKIRRKIRGELKWRYFAPGNDDAQNPLRKLEQSVRDEIRAEIYQIITAQRSIRTLAAICSIETAYKMASVCDQQDIYNLTYKVMTERFQYFLQDVERETGAREYGMIIGDHRGKDDDKKLRAHHQMLLNAPSGKVSKYPHLIESLLLQPSNLSVGIQIADLVAGAVWRKFEREDSRWFDLVQSSLRRSSAGRLDGFGLIKVPKAGWI